MSKRIEITISDYADQLIQEMEMHFVTPAAGELVSRLIEENCKTPDDARGALGFQDVIPFSVELFDEGNARHEGLFFENVNDALGELKACMREQLNSFRTEEKFGANPFTWSKEQRENWDAYIDNCGGYVSVYDPIADEDTYYTELSEKDLKEIGWIKYKEMCEDIINSISNYVFAD